MSPIVLAFTGIAGAGKSTAAAYLAERHGFARTRFAAPLKSMVRAFLADAGLPDDAIERMIERDLKEVATAALGGRTPRYFMQRLGTQFGRDLVCPTLWTGAWQARVRQVGGAGQGRVVVEDCRFPNEVQAIRAVGGLIIEIRADHAGLRAGARGHVSEGQALERDVLIWNDGPMEILHARLDGLIARYAEAA